jgi:hypothetical protein
MKDVSLLAERRAFSIACAASAAIGGSIVAPRYHRLGLTLSHYDSRGHLVVARRIIDSITPGWQQIGAVWLPLPHLLNMIPVQVALFYRTGRRPSRYRSPRLHLPLRRSRGSCTP